MRARGVRGLVGEDVPPVDLTGSTFKETILVNARFSGLIDGLVVNDIEVAPLIEAEMRRRFPDRALMRPDDAAGVRAAWDVLERRWGEMKARAAGLGDDALQTRVDGEWSCAETFRHLIFVTDGWITDIALGRPGGHHPFGLPPNFLTDVPGIDRSRARRDRHRRRPAGAS